MSAVFSEKHARIFSALGKPERVAILRLFEETDEIIVHKIAHRFPCTRAALSHHMRILRSAGVVIGEHKHKEMVYRLDKFNLMFAMEAIHGLVNANKKLLEHP